MFKDYRYGDFKKAIAEVIVEEIGPIRDKKNELLANKEELDRIAAVGAKRDSEIACRTLADVKFKMGIL